MRNVYLITCTRTKSSSKTFAKQLYKSPAFQASRKVAEKYGDLWFILSAKHGLVSPEDQIEPYDLSLISLSHLQRNNWAMSVFQELLPKLSHDDQITILGDDLYANYLAPFLRGAGFCTRVPLLGKSPNARLYWLNAFGNSITRVTHLNRFYKMLCTLKDGLGGMRTFNECDGKIEWPKRGVYFIFEENEMRFAQSSIQRVVRVGTHAVSLGSKSSLWQRLRTHRGIEGGGGRHRSSIFRLHVGAAMIAKSNGELNMPTWGLGQTATKNVQTVENVLEHKVTSYIGKMKILWVSINDAPSAESDRAYIERNSIALLSGNNGPLDPPSEDWLGNYNPIPIIKNSGLWNINYVDESYDERFLDIFDEYVDITLGKKKNPTKSLAPRDWLKSRFLIEDPNQMTLFKEGNPW